MSTISAQAVACSAAPKKRLIAAAAAPSASTACHSGDRPLGGTTGSSWSTAYSMDAATWYSPAGVGAGGAQPAAHGALRHL